MEMETVTVEVEYPKIYLLTYTFTNVPNGETQLWHEASQYIEKTFSNVKIDNTTYLIGNKISNISNKKLCDKISIKFNKILKLHELEEIAKFKVGVFGGDNFSHVNLSHVKDWIKNNL